MKDYSKVINALKFIREECLNGRPINGRDISASFKLSNMFLEAVRQLGYIKPKNGYKKKYYTWTVGEVIPVMGKATTERTNEIMMKYRSPKTAVLNDNRVVLPHIEKTVSAEKSVDWEPYTRPTDDENLKIIEDLKARIARTESSYLHDMRRASIIMDELRNKNKALPQVPASTATQSLKIFKLFGIKIYEKYVRQSK